ncbi:hypothetical protein AT268_32630 [Bacillus cereus]|uniref:Uncharacterized protein n=1 Tax=Bacillus cereus TaxID=1396 RepID=A0A9X0MK28_BACCE|nr:MULTISPECIES: hypothetical protein [Bacillus cereus group]PEZ75389.1 hypothetical protein CN410_15105 [Bacillus anthracis]KXY51239.1 hypothetical protein AT268_32630 [Bacillus cereus]PES55176.1 hypothetical protein CN515_03720 [Bacillus cereus]PFA29577.1 hypothetical protein CN384_07745 [Bacillus thuringiensis]PGW10523.1 hypothetical protein COD97_16630 [Bacillus cereus]
MIKIYDNIPRDSVYAFLEKAKELLNVSSFHLFFLPYRYTKSQVKEVVSISKSREKHIQYMFETNESGFVFKNTIVYISSEWNQEMQLRLLKDLYRVKMWNAQTHVSEADVNAIVKYIYNHSFKQKQNLQISA